MLLVTRSMRMVRSLAMTWIDWLKLFLALGFVIAIAVISITFGSGA